MSNLRSDDKLRNIQPTDVVLGADENGCLFNIPPDNFSGSIPISIDTETGAGEELFTEPELNSFLFKKIKSEDESVGFTTDTDGNINASVNFPDFPEIDYPVTESEDVGNGVSLRRSVDDKKIGIRTLKSDGFIISEETDGSVKINPVGGGSVSNDYYLDVNFTRPSNWTEKAEEIDGIKTAQGTLNDPFKSFEEYLRRCVGETGGSNGYGLYSRVNPKNPYKKLRLLSDLTTDKVLEINNSKIYLENNITLIYNGSESRCADTARLWNAMPKIVGVLSRSISYEIGGEGTLINLNNFGVINHKTSEASTTNYINSTFYLSPTLSGLKFKESPESAAYNLLTNGDGSPYLEAGIQVKGSTQAPTTPLITVDGKNISGFAFNISGTTLELTTSTQSFIQIINEGSININCDQIKYLVDIFNIGYEKKLFTGLGGITADETELLIGRNGLFFKPYSSRKVFDISGYARIERISTISQHRLASSVDSIFHVNTNSTIDILEKYTDTGGGSSISLISSSGVNTMVNLNNTLQTSYMNFFAKGDNTNPVNVKLESGNVNKIDKVKKNISVLNLSTEGTWSTIKSIPINTGLASFVNNAAAVSANYIPGMAYYNTTESAISIVI